MRRIAVNEEIKLLAEKYAKGLEIGKNLSAKPLNSLKDLKDAMKKIQLKLYSRPNNPIRKAIEKEFSPQRNYLNMQNTYRL